MEFFSINPRPSTKNGEYTKMKNITCAQCKFFECHEHLEQTNFIYDHWYFGGCIKKIQTIDPDNAEEYKKRDCNHFKPKQGWIWWWKHPERHNLVVKNSMVIYE